ncbi:deoxyribose-phosphate aldolase [Actinoplanes cyaneus]|uniref:Deoxyribose-phosphate aldolase n=1 Tax=Actinoplanes cyaneus TaxID=52696 RepID=A0A919ME59_9ACTN|nr:deoxyribose-phosphate aldolase [Actinoplanes cyaneus]MCW2139844.1 deoxyribose-phosphate aldolase [Actinoplanes cyaneus]GID67866.1 deoxyribose-phosphate aldolase [Actinoplanes cyaneus]
MNIAKMIDHSLLRPELTTGDVRHGCEIAARRQVASVCVRPSDVALATAALTGTGVLVGTVVGFPHGDTLTSVKAGEARQLVEAGADEIDMVLHIGRLRSGDTAYVHDDIAAVVAAAAGRVVKVILENAYLSDEQKVAGCRLAEEAGAHFVKTSTGFAPGGATLADIRLMRAAVSPHVEVKAAGGVRSLDTLLALHDAGATRFGATATEAILDDFAARARGESPAAATATDGGGY